MIIRFAALMAIKCIQSKHTTSPPPHNGDKPHPSAVRHQLSGIRHQSAAVSYRNVICCFLVMSLTLMYIEITGWWSWIAYFGLQ